MGQANYEPKVIGGVIMNFITVFLVAVALGTDAMSMAIGLGLSGARWKRALIIALVVAAFHIVMPLIGLSVGSLLGKIVGKFASIIGALILALLGGHMIWDTIKPEVKGRPSVPIARKLLGDTKGKKSMHVVTGLTGILLVAGSVSLDALTVGFGLGTLKANLFLTVITMGAIAGIMTLIGFLFGTRLGKWLGEKAQLIGGIVLIGIGIKMLFV
jgi:putative Mn2+ efflux pump MntP